MVLYGTGFGPSDTISASTSSGKANLPKPPSVELTKAKHKNENELGGLPAEYLGTEDEFTGSESSSSGSEGDNESVNSNDCFGTPQEYLDTEDEYLSTEGYASETAISEDDNDHDNDTNSDLPARTSTPKGAGKAAAFRTATNAVTNGGKKTSKTSAKGNKGTRSQQCIKVEPATSINDAEDLEDSVDNDMPAGPDAKRIHSRIDIDDTELFSDEGVIPILIDGYGFHVPVDPVECFHKVRRHVLAAYRRIEAKEGTKRDLAVVIGSGTAEGAGGAYDGVDGGVHDGGRGGRKRAAEDGKGGDLEEGSKVKRYRAEAVNKRKQGNDGERDATAGASGRGARGLLSAACWLRSQ